MSKEQWYMVSTVMLIIFYLIQEPRHENEVRQAMDIFWEEIDHQTACMINLHELLSW